MKINGYNNVNQALQNGDPVFNIMKSRSGKTFILKIFYHDDNRLNLVQGRTLDDEFVFFRIGNFSFFSMSTNNYALEVESEGEFVCTLCGEIEESVFKMEQILRINNINNYDYFIYDEVIDDEPILE